MLSGIHLSNFRNFKKKEIDLSGKTTVIVGPNATGKTNILEAIYLLATGKSFRARVEEEMVRHGDEIARVKGIVDGDGTTELGVVLTRGEITLGEDPTRIEKAPRKRLLVDGMAKRLIDFSGRFRVVSFLPKDLDLVTESPSMRRNFLDVLLTQTDREYRRALLSYEKGLRQRNKLLQKIRDEGYSRNQLHFWDKLLIKNGDYISNMRQEYLDFANAFEHDEIAKYTLNYDKSGISEGRLEQYAQEEVYAATTLVGPHRDDFAFIANKRDLSRFGSRGEQRMGVLWLKLTELEFIKEKTGERPTLLLDDIFSELDHEHRDIVVNVANGQQTIITTAEPHYVEKMPIDKTIKLV